jgi:RNA polymerase sigma factor (sigma-70 family)
MAAGSHAPIRAGEHAGKLHRPSQRPPPTGKPAGASGTTKARSAQARRPVLGSSRQILKLASDERLVGRLRAGSEPAFAVLYERYYRNILSFCRHMLGSSQQAEDAVQQTFINAYTDLLRDERELNFRPWLYRIARNHCISLLRRRREQVELEADEPSLVGLSEKVAGRADLRDLLADLARLPVEQREALILSELQDNSHAEVAEILGCDREKVKSLVFQARSSLISSRDARDVSCEEIRGQLSILRGGSLRRNVIRRHLKTCDACRAFSHEVRQQRQALALILPVFPSSALKLGAAKAIACAKAGAGTTGGGAVVAAGAGTGAGGVATSSLTAIAGKLGVPAVLVKGLAATGAVAILAGGGTVAVKDVQDALRKDPPAAAQGPSRTGSEGSQDATGQDNRNGLADGKSQDATSGGDGKHRSTPNGNSSNGRLHSALSGRTNAPGHTKAAGQQHRAVGKGGVQRLIGGKGRARQPQGNAPQGSPNGGWRPAVSKPAPGKPTSPRKVPVVPSRPANPRGTLPPPAEGTTGP